MRRNAPSAAPPPGIPGNGVVAVDEAPANAAVAVNGAAANAN